MGIWILTLKGRVMSNLIGITGFARAGKDTFYELSARYLETISHKSERFAFADVLKSECDELTLKHTGISCFTSDDREKFLIRPLLVAYGTHLRRELNPNCWIDGIRSKVSSSLDSGNFVFITDVRFKNEADWILSEGGHLVNVVRDGVGPANPDEASQSELISPLVDHTLTWPTFGVDSLYKGAGSVLPINIDIMDKYNN